MIGILYNLQKPCLGTVNEIKNYFDSISIAYTECKRYPFTEETYETIEKMKALIVIGGDGTVLHAVELIGKSEIPIIPVHFGTMGFLCSISGTEIISFLKTLCDNTERFTDFTNPSQYSLDHRNFLKITFEQKEYFAFNEIAVNRGSSPTLLTFDLHFNGMHATTFRADGVVVSTTSGSTAYNLSAGGPIVHPRTKAFIFTPVCPHSLTIKPLVVPFGEELILRFENKVDNACIEIDGKRISSNVRKGEVSCSLASEKITFLKTANENYYKVLKEKLHWGK